MKKFLRTLLILAVLWVGFFTIKKNARLSLDSTQSLEETSITGLVFVNDAWFTKTPTISIEDMAEYPDGIADINKCKADPASFWGIEVCNNIQKQLDSYVLADYFIEYSGFAVYVLNTTTAPGHEQMLASWMLELTPTSTYPINLIKNILTNTIWMNRGRTPSVVEMPEYTVANADTTRTFISFEGQDGMGPTIHIIFKKWDYLVRITNLHKMDVFGIDKLSPAVTKTLKDFYDAQMAYVDKDPNHKLKPENIINYYTDNVATNTEYAALLNETITNALSRFAIK